MTEWGGVFGDAVVATAILDRLLHHSYVFTVRGDSYRLRNRNDNELIFNWGQNSMSSKGGSTGCRLTAQAPQHCLLHFWSTPLACPLGHSRSGQWIRKVSKPPK